MQLATNPKLLLKPLDIYFKELGIEDEFSIDESLVIKMLKNDRDLPNKYECALNIIKDVIAKRWKGYCVDLVCPKYYSV